MAGTVRVLVALIALCAAAVAARAERRLAFVAGIDSYPRLTPEQQLKRAVADADAVSATLTDLGFQVTRVGRDATLFGFHTAFGTFTQRIEPGDTVLVFFAGHGVAIDNTNYMLPSDIPALTAGQEGTVRNLSVAEPSLIADIQARGARVTMLVIDACRDNPFPKSGTRSLGLARGFARAEPPEGVFSLYSAGAGQTALDRLSEEDSDANSVFTRIFLSELKRPGTNLIDLGESVREEVSRLARGVGHQQIPAVYNQVLGARRIQLAGLAAGVSPPLPEPPRPAPAPVDPDANTWLVLKDSQDLATLRRFAGRLSAGPLRREVEARIAALVEAERTRLAARPPVADVTRDEAADAARACDRLAASPVDKDRPAANPGVALGQLDAKQAIPACRRAVAASPRSARLLFQLGRSLHAGRSNEEAVGVLRRAADLGSVIAVASLGYMYEQGFGVAKDEEEAARHYRRAAELGSAPAMDNLGVMYRDGRGVAQDDAEAVRLYRRAADLGHPDAINNLGVMYEAGRGLAKNDAEAVRLFRRAADLGTARAMFNLGVAYHGGRGVQADRVQARRWFRRAVDAGLANANTALAQMDREDQTAGRPPERRR